MNQVVTVDLETKPPLIAVTSKGMTQVYCRDEYEDLNLREEGGLWTLGNQVPELITLPGAGMNCHPCTAGHSY